MNEEQALRRVIREEIKRLNEARGGYGEAETEIEAAKEGFHAAASGGRRRFENPYSGVKADAWEFGFSAGENEMEYGPYGDTGSKPSDGAELAQARRELVKKLEQGQYDHELEDSSNWR